MLISTAVAIRRHLQEHHPAGSLRMCVPLPWQDLEPQVIEMCQQIPATGKLPASWPEPVHGVMSLPVRQFPDGHLIWQEEWWYPPLDLLARLIEGHHIGPQGILRLC